MVTKKDWGRFTRFLISLTSIYDTYAVDSKNRTLVPISDIHNHLSGFRDSMRKGSREFSVFVIPELSVVLEESWDFTWLLHYKQKRSLEFISQTAKASGLHVFSDQGLLAKRKRFALKLSGKI
jgi:hypothetical protein